MLKKLTLAALAGTFIAGSAAVANAEISNGGASPAPTSERGLAADYARHAGGISGYALQQWHHPMARAKRGH
jgi:hypothetical protein